MHFTGDVTGCTTNSLNQRCRRSQETFLIGIEDRHQAHFRQVQALTQQVNAHQYVIGAHPQLPQQLNSLQGIDVTMQVTHTNTGLGEVVGKVLRHLLRQRCHQYAFIAFSPDADLFHQIINLALGRFDDNLRIHQARRANNLLNELTARRTHFISARSRGHVDALAFAGIKLVPSKRPVIKCRRQPEAMLDQIPFTRGITLKHGADLRNCLVRLVNDGEKVLGEIINQRCRR